MTRAFLLQENNLDYIIIKTDKTIKKGKYFPHLSKIALRTVVNQTLSWLHDWTLVQVSLNQISLFLSSQSLYANLNQIL